MGRVNLVQKSPILTRRRSRQWFILLLTATAIACFPSLPIESAEQQQNAKPSVQPRRNNRKSLWESILQLLQRRNEPALSSRSNVCAIAPGLLGETNVIWSDRPLFIWHGGSVQRLEIRPFNLNSSYDSQEVLWSQTVTPRHQSAMYTGEALQPGQTYDWEIAVVDSSSRHDSKPRPLRFTFQVMEAPRRDRIATELKALETQFKTLGATAEEVALARANYFAERDLWSDALQEVFLVQNPSADSTRTAQKISTYLCDPNS